METRLCYQHILIEGMILNGIKKILVGVEGVKAKGNLDLEIKGIESNSKKK